MSPAVVNGLVLFFTALLFLLLAVSLAPATRPPLNRAAGQALNDLIAGFDEDLREGADTRARMCERGEVRKKDIQACYRERRVRRVPGAVEGVTRYRTITFSAASVIFALPVFPHFPHLSSGNKMFADAAGAIVAAVGRRESCRQVSQGVNQSLGAEARGDASCRRHPVLHLLVG